MRNQGDLYEQRKGYFVIRRTHPVTREEMTRKGRNKLALLTWGAEVDTVRQKLAAGLISTDGAIQALAKSEGESMRVQEVWDEYMATISNRNTRRTYTASWENHLKEPFAQCFTSELTETVMKKWVKDMLEKSVRQGAPISPTTIANAFNALQAAMGLQVRDKRLPGLPWGSYKMRAKKRKDTLERETLRDADEMRRVLEECAREDARHRGEVSGSKYADLAPRVTVALLSGLRQGELGGLGWDDLVLRAGKPRCMIRHAVTKDWHRAHPDWTRPLDTPKNDKVDEVPVHRDFLIALHFQRENLRQMGPCLGCGAKTHEPCAAECKKKSRGWYRPDGPIFPGKGGKWRRHPRCINVVRLRDIVRRAVPDADAARFVVHSLRHSMASMTLGAFGNDPRRAMVLTRHSSIDVFQKYIHKLGRAEDHNPLPRIGVDLDPQGRTRRALPPRVEPDVALEVDDLVGELVEAAAPIDADELFGERATGAEGLVADILATSPEMAREYEARRIDERKEAQNQISARYRAKNATDFETAYQAWTAKGRPGIRPFQVTAAMTLVYEKVRKGPERRNEAGRFTVPRGATTWERIAAAALGLKAKDGPPSAEAVAALRAQNEDRAAPPRPGAVVLIPPKWEGARRGRAAKARVLGAWMVFLQRRDAAAALAGTAVEDLHDAASEGSDAEDDGDDRAPVDGRPLAPRRR